MPLERTPVPEGAYDDLAREVIAAGGRVGTNEYGSTVSIHTCAACGSGFTVCPPSTTFGDQCLAEECSSYDPSRDASVFF